MNPWVQLGKTAVDAAGDIGVAAVAKPDRSRTVTVHQAAPVAPAPPVSSVVIGVGAAAVALALLARGGK